MKKYREFHQAHTLLLFKQTFTHRVKVPSKTKTLVISFDQKVKSHRNSQNMIVYFKELSVAQRWPIVFFDRHLRPQCPTVD